MGAPALEVGLPLREQPLGLGRRAVSSGSFAAAVLSARSAAQLPSKNLTSRAGAPLAVIRHSARPLAAACRSLLGIGEQSLERRRHRMARAQSGQPAPLVRRKTVLVHAWPHVEHCQGSRALDPAR